MTVFIVVADNNEAYEDNVQWNYAVCASYEAAERCIQEACEAYAKDTATINELENTTPRITYVCEKLSELRNRWSYARECPTFRIEEHTLIE